MLPQSRPSRFFDGVDIFAKIHQILHWALMGMDFRSVALFSLGGIGKSSIAATYPKRKYDENEYNVVLWVHGETAVYMRQSFTDITIRCGAKHRATDDNLFQSTGASYLF